MRNPTLAIMAIALFALPVNPSIAETPIRECAVSAIAIDGDTIDCAGTRVRLAGLDAPELRQHCERAGARWPCGQAAADALRDLIASRTIDCERIATDRYGRAIAICAIGDSDIGDLIVRAGMALNDSRYEPDYGEAEAAARAERIGLHAGSFVAPWLWRRGARLD